MAKMSAGLLGLAAVKRKNHVDVHNCMYICTHDECMHV